MIAGADLVRYLMSAGGVTCLFLLAALWLQRGARTRAPRIVLLIAVAVTFFGIYGIQYRISRLLVGSLRPLEASDVPAGGRVAVVVLGSGSKTVENWSGQRFSVVDRSAAARVFEAFRVYQLIHPAVVISSGGEPHPERRHEPTGNTMRDALLFLGVPRSQIIVETISKTTRDEAVVIAPMLGSLGIDRVVLVTAEVHMRRSLGVFRAAGVRAIPAIANDNEAPDSWSLAVLPTDEGLLLGQNNVHELLGIAYYRLRGWWTR